jgi:hypothetical protein
MKKRFCSFVIFFLGSTIIFHSKHKTMSLKWKRRSFRESTLSSKGFTDLRTNNEVENQVTRIDETLPMRFYLFTL